MHPASQTTIYLGCWQIFASLSGGRKVDLADQMQWRSLNAQKCITRSSITCDIVTFSGIHSTMECDQLTSKNSKKSKDKMLNLPNPRRFLTGTSSVQLAAHIF